MEVSGQLYAPTKLPHGRKPTTPLDRKLGQLYSQYGYTSSKGKKKIPSLPLLGIKLWSFSP